MQSQNLLTNFQKIFLLLSALILAIAVFFLRLEFGLKSPLEQLARKSIAPEIALKNGRPTIIEFYADWCEACQAMAPAMLSNEIKFSNDLDFVLLNVDNSRWQPLVKQFEVYGTYFKR